jgi:sterol desaturase/sphingolipid hydroxylase (fatty acid hydroxylase superfamily)
LRHALASPVFHRWHHSAEAAAQSSNFAPMFSLWDVLFGTFHMPDGRLPQSFGAEGAPVGFVRQLIQPFAALGRAA